jgi:hypothetical protein
MTSTVFFDPEKVSKLEPSEGDERNKAMLSPSAVQRSVSIEFPSRESISIIRFQYSGGETARGQEPLDDRVDPAVMVRTSALTHKVLELSFTPSVGVDGLKEIAERLDLRARVVSTMTIGKRLSYRMIASLLAELVIDAIHAAEGLD